MIVKNKNNNLIFKTNKNKINYLRRFIKLLKIMFSNSFFILIRTFLRKIGFIYLLKKTNILKPSSGIYEEKFDDAMQNVVSSGMKVFDVGANIGFYSQKFANLVGSKGHVYAFEPITASANKITTLKNHYPWITVNETAVGDYSGKVFFEVDQQDLTSPTNKVLINKTENDQNIIEKSIDTIDSLVKKHEVPNVIKIDVEGLELNVIRGAEKTLLNKNLKHIFIEIHFSILEQRGQHFAPKEIKMLLERCGFKVTYIDLSHIHAYRD